MFWSSSPSSSSSASSSSTSSTTSRSSPSSSPAESAPTSTGPTSPVSENSSTAGWTTDSKGPAGLGVISSLSPECTPLKHRYDSCFDRWFTDYLAIGDAQILEQQQQGSGLSGPTAGPAAAPSKKKSSSWFGSSDNDSAAGSAAGGLFSSSDGQGADPELERRKREIMERYERDCGKLFQEYRQCVKRAATAKGLDALIEEARAENPFPFDHQRRGDARENNPPFPFPAARQSAN